ncbi:MAG TPA: hypothetical protein DCP31_04140, partial [Cyanobacteria bacterium UBA8543]|nr:hypothetical protein [Cyanobacteria bacterium UBA8543]
DTVKLWHRNGSLIRTLQGRGGDVFSVNFSPDSQLIASANNDKTAKLWSREGKLLTTLSGHKELVNSVSFSP